MEAEGKAKSCPLKLIPLHFFPVQVNLSILQGMQGPMPPTPSSSGRARNRSASNAFFSETILLLGGAVVAAPIFKKLGLGTVLGYLAA
ncbi:hypothetical protein, partial [Rhizobium johnstonii]|uniref:hypothetical protein n=1 Tax=Rhizobium johnstonii TaxID=3019933 RepID=UPI003F98CB23